MNELLARSAGEVALFEGMDVAQPPPPLLGGEEVPGWVTDPPLLAAEREDEVALRSPLPPPPTPPCPPGLNNRPWPAAVFLF